MILNFLAVSSRGRKAYKDDTGTVHLVCTKCDSIKPLYVKAKNGVFLR